MKWSLFLFIPLWVWTAGLAPAEKAGREAKELRRWADGPVQYILSNNERTAWKRLKTDPERQAFIDQFWRVRDPHPQTPENEFKAEFDRRVQYANDHFAGEVLGPGWQTERGRYYILLGPPQSKATFKGYGQLYPMELWFYASRNLPNLPPFFYLLFYQRDEVGDYRRYSPFVDGPLKLVKGNFRDAAGAYQFLKGIDAELARASLSLITGEPLDLDTFTPSMASDALIAKIHNLPNELEKNRKLFREFVAVNVSYGAEPFDLAFLPVREGSDRYALHYALQIDPSNFDYGRGEGTYYLSWNIHAKIYDPQYSKIILEKDREVVAKYGEADFARVKDRPFSFADKLSLPPGRYTAEITVEDRVRRRSHSVAKVVSVSEDHNQPLWLGDLLLFHGHQILNGSPSREAAPAFQFHGVQFFPEVKRTLVNQDALHVLFQVGLSPERRAGGKIVLEYQIINFNDSARRFSLTDEVAKAKFDQDGSLLNSKTLSLKDLPPGRYSLTIKVNDTKDGLSSVKNIFFNIAHEAAAPKPTVFVGVARASQ